MADKLTISLRAFKLLSLLADYPLAYLEEGQGIRGDYSFAFLRGVPKDVWKGKLQMQEVNVVTDRKRGFVHNYHGTFGTDSDQGNERRKQFFTSRGIKGHFNGNYYEISEKGRRFVEENRALFIAAEAEREAAVRYVVVKRAQSHHSVFSSAHVSAPGIGPLCKVIRETAKRLYVEVVKMPKARKFEVCLDAFVQGTPGNQYVDRENVMIDPVDPDAYDTMLIADREYQGYLSERADEEAAEIAAIKLRFKQRREQRDAQFQDEISEITKRLAPKS